MERPATRRPRRLSIRGAEGVRGTRAWPESRQSEPARPAPTRARDLRGVAGFLTAFSQRVPKSLDEAVNLLAYRL
jgi:hypothetical protein